ncbi:MAG: orotate phosphoribosyltransferase [Alphaproteobacteria bacterium]|nr:orotate phosphoribosyltransferase [Alphaproteobacteria bacterium]
MTRDEILQEFSNAGAMLSGHFILSSGLHSTTYLQCARVLMDARRGERLCRALAEKIRSEMPEAVKVDQVVSPAMGGVVVGYEMGRQLGVPAIFCERIDSTFALRRGFTIESGQRVLIVEDVVTTGKSSFETLECIRQHGADAVAIASLIDRRGSQEAELALPLISLLKLDIPTYALDALPAALQDIPPVKPGSRWLKG